MDRYDKAFSKAAKHLAKAANRTSARYAIGAIPDEPAFTASLIARLEEAIGGFEESGIKWNASILPSHKGEFNEKRFGADFLGLLSLELDQISVTKGFLAQAKRQESGMPLSSIEWDRLVSQCDAMLRVTPESFVFIYSFNGVLIAPAVAVVSSKSPVDLHVLNPYDVATFYKRHFQCYIGDRQIKTGKIAKLADMSYGTGILLSGALSGGRESIYDVADR